MMNHVTAAAPYSDILCLLTGGEETVVPRSQAGPDTVLQNFYSAFASMEDGFFFANRQLRLTYYNPAAESIFRKAYQQEIMIGESIPARLPADRREVVATFFRRALKGETIEYETVLTEEGVAPLWLGCRYFPTRDALGNITGICGILKDITVRKELEKAEAERKKMEEKLLQEKALFEEFMKNTPLRAWIADENGALHYFNPVFAREFGLETAAGKVNVFNLFPEDLAWKYFLQNQEVIRGGRPVVSDEESILPDGTHQNVKLVRFPLTVDGQSMVGGYTVDISAHIRLQEELAKSVEQFEYATKATSDAIYEWDLESGRMQHSWFYSKLFGSQQYPMAHFEGVHPADRDRVQQQVVDTLNDPQKDRWQLEYRHRSGGSQYRHIICKSFVIRRNGKAVRVIGAKQDITEQKKLQERLIEQEKGIKREIVRSVIETQEKERRQLSVELHDNINQMVASCKLMLEIGLSNPANAPLFTEKAYNHLQEIITGILRISHNLNPSTIEDIGLKEALVQLLGKTAVTEKLKIEFTHHHFLEAHLAQPEDKVAVYRLVQEQLANIVQHAGARNVWVRLASGPNKVFLSVEDDGNGCDKEAMVTGRGLRTIYHRVEYYNGKMILDTQPGQGCRLKVLLKTGGR
ncbi:PAS domain S-box protein [Paraflavisolibacter sp. H34]|uniref:PAS domain-containing sensor histidine kinase n=1 Tax=Huijunlia imazamoxiresistens TaxID=3127457 RepID=UPI003018C154